MLAKWNKFDINFNDQNCRKTISKKSKKYNFPVIFTIFVY